MFCNVSVLNILDTKKASLKIIYIYYYNSPGFL